jgi:outer membrane protein
MRLINLNWAVFFCLTSSLTAQQPSATNQSPVREITLEQCVRQALEHNFSIQIQMTGPRIAQYDLQSSYALYEPTFDVEARRDYRQIEGSFAGGQVYLPTEETDESIRSGLKGEAPSGLKYSVGFDVIHRNNQGGTFAGRTQRDDYDTDVGISLSQPLLRDFWTSPDRAQIKINRGNLKISEQLLHLRMMEVVRDVQVAYYELLAAQDEVKVREKALELAQQLFQENRKRVQAGVLAPLDEKQAESEVAIAKANLIVARRLVDFQANVLKNLITDNYQGWHAVTLQPTEKLLAVPEAYDRSTSWMNALSKRPDFNQARLQVENQGIRVELGHNQLFPSLNLLLGYGRSGFDTNDMGSSFSDISHENDPHYFVGTVLSVPLGNRLERNRYRSAKETMKQLQLQLQQLHQAIIVQVDDAIRLADANFQQIPARREARLFAEAALDAEQKKLENGKSTSFVVLQLQSDLTTARSVEIRALAEYNKALAQLYYSEGTILERRNISVEFR